MVMKNLVLFLFCVGSSTLYSQDRPQRGPYNTLPNGVKDGVVIKEEVPVRQAVQPEFVREADLVWSKRVFSRIDSRERINHDIFLPYDYFEGNELSGSDFKPNSPADIDDPTWNKDQRRWSLWTIMVRHLMLGDLTMYAVSSDFYPSVEDGYSFKYPIAHQGQNDYFENVIYKRAINSKIASGGVGPKLKVARISMEDTVEVIKTNQSLDQFLDSLKSDDDYKELFRYEREDLERWWNASKVDGIVRKDGINMFVPSSNILAYNIKEDWFFDKERSLLDRRIIGIAPVARFSIDSAAMSGGPSERGELLVYSEQGVPFNFDKTLNEFVPYNGQVEEREMFWIYFEELRNVIINYYVYNDRNDAQWMSMDDLFWKRKFNSTIYKVSDKFDREIQDYKYGVDALYEAERIKEDIRKWEHDLWHF